jgi:hypothetical protein
MHKITKTMGAGVASLALVALTATSANAESTLIKIGKYGQLSATQKVAFIKIKLTCSEDTTSIAADLTLTQVTAGTVQTAYAAVSLYNAVECSGSEEVAYLPVRRPTGGFKWLPGTARVSDVNLYTEDPSGDFSSHLDGRTVTLR